LGATLTTEEIYDAFYGDHSEFKTFYHGHTYTANPIACSAAIASIDIFKKEGTLGRVEGINKKLRSFLDKMSGLPIVGDVRSTGAVGAMELVKNKGTKEPFGIRERMGLEIYKRGLEEKLLLRPLGNVIYLFLPLCVKDPELDDILDRASRVLDHAAACQMSNI